MRFNYSILSKANDEQAVLDYYTGKEGYKSKAMNDGVGLHEKMKEQRVVLPFMNAEKCEWEYHFECSDVDIDHVISGYIDVFDGEYLVDWKLSTREAGKHDPMQLYFYNYWLMMSTHALIKHKYGVIVQVDKDMNVLSKAMYEFSTKTNAEAVLWYVRRRNKIIDILERNKLI